MKKIDFGKINVEINFEGDIVEVDARKPLGNAIHQTTNDIGFDEFAKKIYFSEGEIEIPEEYINPLKSVVAQFLIVPVQTAINKLLDNQITNN